VFQLVLLFIALQALTDCTSWPVTEVKTNIVGATFRKESELA